MNCKDFETIIIEIARDRLMDASTRAQGLEHADNCARCSALLDEERELTGRLRVLSAAGAEEEIPARLESALLSAFHKRTSSQSAPSAVVSRGLMGRMELSGRRRWILAAAALAALTFGFSLAAWLSQRPDRESLANGRKQSMVSPTPSGSPKVSERQTEKRTPILGPERTNQPANPLNLALKHEKRQQRLRRTGAVDQAAINNPPREFVTRFFPVMQGNEVIPLESAQIVRVRMPRSNLISLGIPVNQDRVDEPIQADVLVSNDGLARAIRLVY